MDDIDRQLVDTLQEGMPICARPFAAVARHTGLSEQQVVERVKRLLQAGFLSRFGPLFNVEEFGGCYVLAAMAVPEAEFDRVTAVLNAVPEIAHNYQREHRLNVWFVVAATSPERSEQVLRDIERSTGIPVRRFPKEREYFVGARFAA
jgi:siroheme decarboxylase